MANFVKTGKCRFCQAPLKQTYVDLGMSPSCQDHLKPEVLNRVEPFYPPHAYVCENCFLAQLEEFVAPSAVVNDYGFFSSSCLHHAKRYTGQMVEQFPFNSESLVAELAGNDGYLLQYFTKKRIPVLGIEPANNVAQPSLGS